MSPEAGRKAEGEGPRALGRRGEELAAAEYERLGFRRIALALRTRGGEIDVLVRKGRLYVVAEVKTRMSAVCPEEAVGPDRTARLRRALWLLAGSLDPRPKWLRVDVVAVRLPPAGEPEVRVFPGEVFEPPRG